MPYWPLSRIIPACKPQTLFDSLPRSIGNPATIISSHNIDSHVFIEKNHCNLCIVSIVLIFIFSIIEKKHCNCNPCGFPCFPISPRDARNPNQDGPNTKELHQQLTT
jgi:hypothetical protein